MSDDESIDPQVDHAELDRLTKRIQRALAAEDRVELTAALRQFERQIRLHFAEEESRLLGEYHVVDAADCEQIEKEHDRLRADVRECSASLAAGLLEPRRVSLLLSDCRQHQAHEDSMMYRWAKSRTPALPEG